MGAVSLLAGGTNQNITLTPSGTGRVQLGANSSSGTATPLVLSTGGTFMSGGTFAASLKIRSYDDGSSNISGIGASGTGMVVGLSYVAPILFYMNAIEAMRVHGSQRLGIGTGSTDSGALLQIGTNTTTSAGGMVFGTDCFLYRSAGGEMTCDTSSTTSNLSFKYSTGTLAGFIQGQSGALLVRASGSNSLILQSGATTALTLDSSQNATFAGSAVVFAAASAVSWSGRSFLSSPSDGVLRLANNAGTDFSRLQFGGTTSSFPALRRNGTALGVRLADDSGDGGFTAGTIVASTCVNISGAASSVAAGVVSYGGTTATTVGAAGGASALPATPLGYIIVNVAGTAAKIPYYNS